MPELNISLVLYKSNEQELLRLLNSLACQRDIRFKLYIFDNSGQKTVFPNLNFEIDYISSQMNLGFGRAHNKNYERASSNSHFLIINPDIYFDDPLLLKKLVTKTKEKSLTSVRILNPDGSLQEVHRLLPRFSDICRRFFLNKIGFYYPYRHTYTLNHFDKTQDFFCPNISGCFMLFSPKLFKEVGGFDENIFLYFEDIDLSRRCYSHTEGKNKVFGELIVYHSWKRAGYSNFETFKIHVLSAVYYFQKYGIFRDDYSKIVNQEIERKQAKLTNYKKDDSLVSVIIPCYNSSSFIEETLESVIAQTHKNLEIITIDDSSTDNTLEILKKFQNRDNRVKIVENPKNLGIGKTRNAGLEAARGKFIAFVDSDDIWDKSKIEKQVHALRDDYSFCFTSYDIINKHGKYLKTYQTIPRLSYEKALAGSPVGFSSTLFKSSDIGNVRFKDVFHEDYLFILEVLGKRPAIGIQESLMRYRKHNNSISRNKIIASKKQYVLYRDYLNLPLMARLKYFFLYAVKGIIKHYL